MFCHFLKEWASKESLSHKELAIDEFYASLRSHQILHLGQVREEILKTNGDVNLLLFPEEEVVPGLPVWPDYRSSKRSLVLSGTNSVCLSRI